LSTKHETTIQPPKSFTLPDPQQLWRYRELAFLLTWKDIKARYKQTILGFGWAILEPVTNMIIFTFVFQQIGDVDTLGYPYLIFNFAALLPWTLLSTTLASVSSVILSYAPMIKKIYFPRIMLPITSVLSRLVDIIPSFIVLIVLMMAFQVPITWKVLWLPVYILLGIIIMVGMGLWFTSLNVMFRDVRYITQFLLRILMWVSPIGYSTLEFSDNIRTLYYLNPFTGIFEGCRWALLGTESFDPYMLVSTTIFASFIFVSGFIYFNRTESMFADIV